MKHSILLILLAPIAVFAQQQQQQQQIPDRAAAVAIQEWYAENRALTAKLERMHESCTPPKKGSISTRDCPVPSPNTLNTRDLRK